MLYQIPASNVDGGEIFIAEHPNELEPRYWICIYPNSQDEFLHGETVFRYGGSIPCKEKDCEERVRVSKEKYIKIHKNQWVVMSLTEEEFKKRQYRT